ncbi:MAG: C40 family peptidase [Bacilli bacterium]|nr:C40 family peptidase [Bacilli bacterium]
MSIFMIETDAVTAGASSLDALASKVSSISSSVSGYDTSCEDFDFASPKAVIASNIEACVTKIKNTSNVLNTVVSSHTALQNSLKFQSSAEKAAEDAAKAKEQEKQKNPGDPTGNNNNKGGSNPTGGSGGTYSGGGGGSTGGGGGYTPIVTTPSTEAPTTTAPETTPAKEPVDIKTEVKGILHDKVSKDALTSLGKKLFEHEDLEYNKAGYATIGGMFIISCAKVYGSVGDVIEFTLKDGQKFKCIIGQIDEKCGDQVKFFVNDDWKKDGEGNFQEKIGDYVTKIQNLGSDRTYTVGAYVTSALDWATATANDNTHGYSQETRWGNPNYDCSSFVISAYEASGIKVKETGASYTGNMKNAFVKAGFEWIPGTPDVNKLQPGDVLLHEGTHTEMYYGNGKMIGAHGNQDGHDGDSGGNEISITNYSNKNWDGVLRYVGKDKPSEKVKAPEAPHVKIAEETTPETTPTTGQPETKPTTAVEV